MSNSQASMVVLILSMLIQYSSVGNFSDLPVTVAPVLMTSQFEIVDVDVLGCDTVWSRR